MERDVEAELNEAVEKILRSSNPRKLIVAGPGTGKTTIFKKLLEATAGDRETRIVLTFIRNLTADLGRVLGGLARVSTLHGYCQSLLHRDARLRGRLTGDFRCVPGMASLIGTDWEILRSGGIPEFVKAMRNLTVSTALDFYFERADYYDSVDFDDSVYRTVSALREDPCRVESLDLVLIDEFQDFNAMEAAFIEALASKNRIVIAGDDDQALYSQLRGASWDHIRSLHASGKYEVFNLPFCMRCPEVIVAAVNDVISRARALLKLKGRIEKPYRHYEPKKGVDSRRYPQITLVETSVQTSTANYIGKWIAQAISTVLPSEITESVEGNEPAVLVIGPKHYLDPIEEALVAVGHKPERGSDSLKRVERSVGLEILNQSPESNVGWRIILEHEAPPIRSSCIRETAATGAGLATVIPEGLRSAVLAEASASRAGEKVREERTGAAKDAAELRIKLTSFEGSKGLSAQHVFIVGLQLGVLPRKSLVEDIEVCRFLVGMTRTKKRCSLIWTRRFAGKPAKPSPFLSWIKRSRCRRVRVDAEYWRKKSGED
jgi:ATP-dependent DNA helicase UvrD/PcrA